LIAISMAFFFFSRLFWALKPITPPPHFFRDSSTLSR
jgi:hypothetical protein